ncbi:winged helix-turn-helix domain-containing protein [Metallosphaera hakonensis]|uniref:ArsR family transcriptional regulator n=2 Tax=Metallosphaera hakonensis TaxID=79601 RepID=A0A2U9IRF4_9CREN|nr:winged helix-turn-helix domain-containing protein [Metallosphaera hakonensis]AWR98547.1 helix-turn-helix domain-containing protein [Metallosphaera hakonensis JCM 8857 = DSM 7519]
MSSGEKDLKELMELLNNKAFSNSARLGIMIALYYENRMSFTELLNFSSLPKSSLSFHLQVLEDEGFIKTYKVFSIGGIRTEIKITDNGKQIIKKYLSYIKNLKEENKK